MAASCWVPPTSRWGLAGVIVTPLRAGEPAQVVRNTARDTVINTNKIILLVFIRFLAGKEQPGDPVRSKGFQLILKKHVI